MANKPEQDIAQIESLLRRLEKEYDQFLAGLQRRAPDATENALLTLIKLYAARPMQNSTLAFKYNSLVARYNAFKTVWTRRQREREEGRSFTPAAVRAVPVRPEPKQLTHSAADPTAYLTANPLHEPRHLEQFFDTYRELREQSGESTAKLRLESFQKALAEKVAQIRQDQGCDAVLIRVVKDQGRTRIVAKPFRRKSDGSEEGA